MKSFIIFSFLIASFSAWSQNRQGRKIGETTYFSKSYTETHFVYFNSHRQVQGFRFESQEGGVVIDSIVFRYASGQTKHIDSQSYPNFQFRLRVGQSDEIRLRVPRDVKEIEITGRTGRRAPQLGKIAVYITSIGRPGSTPRPRPGGRVECRYNGSNTQPFNLNGNFYLGKSKYGYKYSNDCTQSLRKTSHKRLVCNWNGSGYTSYFFRGGNPGKDHFGFKDKENCEKAILESTQDFICNWNGSGYSPYYTSGNGNPGKAHYGFNKYSTCSKVISNATHDFICMWNGSNYQPHEVRSGSFVGKSGFGFTKLESCLDAVRNSRRGQVCNWNGNSGYAKFNLGNSNPKGVYRSLENCNNSIY